MKKTMYSKKNIIRIFAKTKNMISIIAFIVVIFGSMNWLCVGFFQYDLVAGLFGYQGSIFSRLVYIVVGVCAIYLVFAIIKNKGRLTVKKLKKEEQPIVDQITKKDEKTLENDQNIAENVKILSENKENLQNSENFTAQNEPLKMGATESTKKP